MLCSPTMCEACHVIAHIFCAVCPVTFSKAFALHDRTGPLESDMASWICEQFVYVREAKSSRARTRPSIRSIPQRVIQRLPGRTFQKRAVLSAAKCRAVYPYIIARSFSDDVEGRMC